MRVMLNIPRDSERMDLWRISWLVRVTAHQGDDA